MIRLELWVIWSETTEVKCPFNHISSIYITNIT